MTDEQIRQALAVIARQALGYDGPLESGMRLVEDLELDSIRLLTLVTEVEDHFRICLDEDDEATILRVSDLVGIIGRKLAEKS